MHSNKNDYSQEEIKDLEGAGWSWRKVSINKINTGVWFRHISKECHKHGKTEHIEILQESNMQKSQCKNYICRACGAESDQMYEKRINNLNKNKTATNNDSLHQPQKTKRFR